MGIPPIYSVVAGKRESQFLPNTLPQQGQKTSGKFVIDQWSNEHRTG
jgi:hypothetical protein